MEDPRIISALFIFLKMAYYNVLINTLTTESTAVLIPFHTQEIMQPGGIYYGQNAVSKNMLVADRRKLLNGNSFRLGVSGSGKSFSAKEEIVDLALSTEDDILILDPESGAKRSYLKRVGTALH